ncbi:DUF5681 domain-containing protein [Catalinimonas sp. 4WD22]|uniref:DUF5681 domain-containing protein n=1 Tax=Catalinimonas locisalis TaxID=3133978 RepID=UPI00310153EA
MSEKTEDKQNSYPPNLFQPGQSGNPNGRPKGSSEKTKMWARLGEYITQEGAERYMNILQNMNDDEFIKRFEMILEYFQPKQSRVEAKVESTHTTVTIEAPIPKRQLGEGYNMISIPEKVEEAEIVREDSGSNSNS